MLLQARHRCMSRPVGRLVPRGPQADGSPAGLAGNRGSWILSRANALGQMLLDEYGLKMVRHPHGDSHIETPEEIGRIFDATDPTYVNLCLDSGHVVYGGDRARW